MLQPLDEELDSNAAFALKMPKPKDTQVQPYQVEHGLDRSLVRTVAGGKESLVGRTGARCSGSVPNSTTSQSSDSSIQIRSSGSTA